MKADLKDRIADDQRYLVLVILTAVVITAFMAASGFTSDKAQKIKVHKRSKEVNVMNIGCDTELLNPLRMDEYPGINDAVEEHYEELALSEGFVEKYDDIHVYTKAGKYKDTYIAFVQYRMKIKDIYTEVPGMSTLYVRKCEEGGSYQIETDVPDEQEKEYILALAMHKDVAGLMAETQKEYDAAVESDALLKEGLSDLKDAYDDSAG